MFKLLIEITEDNQINMNHEGQVDPIILLGALRTLEHSLLHATEQKIEMKEKDVEDGPSDDS